jgi:hypothetical protein
MLFVALQRATTPLATLAMSRCADADIIMLCCAFSAHVYTGQYTVHTRGNFPALVHYCIDSINRCSQNLFYCLQLLEHVPCA